MARRVQTRGPKHDPTMEEDDDVPYTGHRATDEAIRNSLAGFDFVIDKTWDGNPVDHDPINVHLEWHFERIPNRPHKRVIKVYITAPLFDDPEPPAELPGICPGLWDYEVIELFFANRRDQYLEVEVGPHGHWLCLMFDGHRKCFNNGEELELSVQNTFVGNVWQCCIEIPLAYLPGGVCKFNAYAIHGSGEERAYEALHAVTDGTFDKPDFHRLEFFGKFELKKIMPESYTHSGEAFKDFSYENFWEHKEGEKKK